MWNFIWKICERIRIWVIWKKIHTRGGKWCVRGIIWWVRRGNISERERLWWFHWKIINARGRRRRLILYNSCERGKHMWVSSVSGWVQEEQSDDLFGKCLYNKKYLMGKLQKKVQEAVIGENEV